jgi:MFS family permease
MSLAGFTEFVRHPRQQPTNLAFVNGFMYGLSLNAMSLLIPLYAIQQGFRLSDQGILIAAPAVFMIALRLPGGAISDRFGERIVITFAFVTSLLGAIIAIFADNMMPLIVSQLLSGASRSVYWSAAQSYISRSSEGNTGKAMGKQLAFETGAGILGASATGFIAQIFGFHTAFTIAAALCTAGLIVTSNLPSLPRKGQIRSIKQSFAPAGKMMFSRNLAFAHLVAFTGAAYASLVGGLFIAYFRELGYSEGLTGVVRSLNGLGTVVVAFFFGTILARFGARAVGLWGMVLTGVLTIWNAHTGDIPGLATVLMTASGISFGTLRTLYPTLAAEKSHPNERAMALAVVSLYWAVAMLLVPLVFGFIADGTSISTALTIFGMLSIVIGLFSPLVYKLGETDQAHARAAPEVVSLRR